jgi:hypothetical protein
MAVNASAAFTFVFSVNSDVKNGSAVYEWAKTETSTNEPDKSNNISDIYASSTPPGGGGGTCTLDCPEDVNAVADTEEGGQRGAHVTFSPTTTAGDCGTVTTTPASGSFFPVGNTTVTSTSELNGGSCTFIVTVEDQGTNPPTISCPTNKQANADSVHCFVNVAVGTATATGNNVTVTASRSDGKPMYTCDANGTNCTRRSSDDPFPAGITTITWIAHSHDTAGPYADADDEEAHRTGAASCSQTVTINDVTPPQITAPPGQTASADANCMAAVPDFTATATVSDNCACSSSTDDCVDRDQIIVTQDPAPGTMVGLGQHTITLTANDQADPPNTSTAQTTFTVKDTTAPVINCPANKTANTDPGICSAVVDPGTATGTDNCDNSLTITGTRSDNQPLNAPYPKGTTTITWTAKDDATPPNESSCQQTITVEDHEAPVITTNGLTPMLWPANHAYHTFNVTDFVTAVSDNCTSLGVGDVVIQKVTSDETENGGGDGNTFNDIIIAADCKSVQLRAERRNSADGRVYTITFKVTDSSGNVTTKTATVDVPKNLGVPVVDSGPNYTVTSNCP